MQDQDNNLLELRSQIAAHTKQLVMSGVGEPESRIQMLMEFIRSGESTIETYRTAYEVIQQLANDDSKMTALLNLLYEIDKNIAIDTESEQKN